jgi:hypothetical protein
MGVCATGGRGGRWQEGDESGVGWERVEIWFSPGDTYKTSVRRGSNVRGAAGSSAGVEVGRLWNQLARKSRLARSVLFVPGGVKRGRR